MLRLFVAGENAPKASKLHWASFVDNYILPPGVTAPAGTVFIRGVGFRPLTTENTQKAEYAATHHTPTTHYLGRWVYVFAPRVIGYLICNMRAPR